MRKAAAVVIPLLFAACTPQPDRLVATDPSPVVSPAVDPLIAVHRVLRDQQAQITALQARVDQLRADIAALRSQAAPGDTAYRVADMAATIACLQRAVASGAQSWC